MTKNKNKNKKLKSQTPIIYSSSSHQKLREWLTVHVALGFAEGSEEVTCTEPMKILGKANFGHFAFG